MTLRLLIDLSAGHAVAESLRGLGHDVLEVRDHDPRMADVDILAWAVSESRLVVTMDKDFGELVHRSGVNHSGVLLLRLDDERALRKVAVIEAIFASFADELPGRFAVYQDSRLRIR